MKEFKNYAIKMGLEFFLLILFKEIIIRLHLVRI